MELQNSLFQTLPADKLYYEKLAYAQGFISVAGVDEVGRGPLAGPVMAAAVILPAETSISGVDDSKKLSESKREYLFEVISEKAISIGIGSISPEIIDKINILQATRLAMLNAVTNLATQPDFLLIDGITAINSKIQQKTIKKGDSLSISIAAASIIAKVTRDRLMTEMDILYPGYGFSANKGYGSARHLEALQKLGPTPIHRLTFGGVKISPASNHHAPRFL
jgi:ribonuclease HII